MENNDTHKHSAQIQESTSTTTSIPTEIASPEKESSFGPVFEKWEEELHKLKDDFSRQQQQNGQLIEEVSTILNSFSKTAEQTEQKINLLHEKLNNKTKDNIELLGIFVTLFTFISVSASVALQIKSVYHASLFISVFCLCLFAFLHVFHNFIQASEPQRGFQKLCGICMLVFFVVIMLGVFCWQTEQKRASTETHATASLKVADSSTPQLDMAASTKTK